MRATVDDIGQLVSYDDYDPWGMTLAGRSMTAQANLPNKFTGKERDTDFGLDWDYFGARYYDPVVGRFFSPDPLAHKFPFSSPYVYAANNPLRFIDPDGKETTSTIDYDEETKRHTITSTSTNATRERTVTQNSDGTTTATAVDVVETTTTTVTVDENGNYVDADGNQVSGVTQTTTVTKRVSTSNSDGTPGSTTSELLSSNTATVSPGTNRLGNALSGWLSAGNEGTPFTTMRDVATGAKWGGRGFSALKWTGNLVKGGSPVGWALSAFGWIAPHIPGSGSIKNRHFYDANVHDNVLNPLHPFYKKK